MRHRRFACARLPDPYMTRSQPRLLTMTFTTADFGRSSSWQSPPARRPRCLHLSHSTTPARLLDTTPPGYPCPACRRAARPDLCRLMQLIVVRCVLTALLALKPDRTPTAGELCRSGF